MLPIFYQRNNMIKPVFVIQDSRSHLFTPTALLLERHKY